MSKFFINQDQIDENEKSGLVNITGADAKHIKGSLRCKEGDFITVSDNAGTDFSCKIVDMNKDNVVAEIVKRYPSQGEPALKITLFQGMPKGAKMELIIEKCVELGVHQIIPVLTEHTIVRELSENKLSRFNKISEAAAKQCGRGYITKVTEMVDLQQAAALSASYSSRFFANERETENHIGNEARKGLLLGDSICIFIGPEGGFSPGEISFLQKSGLTSVSLGNRILRTETAGFMAIIIFLYERGLI